MSSVPCEGNTLCRCHLHITYRAATQAKNYAKTTANLPVFKSKEDECKVLKGQLDLRKRKRRPSVSQTTHPVPETFRSQDDAMVLWSPACQALLLRDMTLGMEEEIQLQREVISAIVPTSGHFRFVYALKVGELPIYKIGFSVDVEARRKQLQTGCPYKLKIYGVWRTDKFREKERAVHAFFRSSCTGPEHMGGREFFTFDEFPGKQIAELIYS